MTLLDPATVPAAPPAGPPVSEPDLRSQPGPPRTSAGRALLVVAGVVVGWAAAVAAALSLETGYALHQTALFVHLAFLVAGFGAVLTLDWFGGLWMLGRKRLADVLEVAESAHLLIWVGLLGLTLTGLCLEPVVKPLTMVKMVAVLVIALNGLNAMALNRSLGRLTGTPSRGLLVWLVVTGAVSQLGWWTATLIGFLNAH